MIYCERCDTANRDGSKFCNSCGYPLEQMDRRACPSCGYVNPAESKFCTNCGAELIAPSPPSAEEEAEPAPEETLPVEEEAPEELPFPPEELSEWLEAGEEGIAPPSAPFHPPEIHEPPFIEAREEIAPLAGINDVIPIASAFALPRSSSIREGAFLPGLETEQGRILADIVAPRPTEERGLRIREEILRRIIYVALALATLLPLLWGVSFWEEDITIGSSTTAFYSVVEGLSQEAVVLISFDYEPGMTAELDPQAQAIIDHVMRHGLRIVAMSLLPQGPALAQRMLEEGAGHDDEYLYGRDYLNLGYLPGREAGLRVLAEEPLEAFSKDYRDGAPVTDFPIAEELAKIEDIALIIELAGSEEMARMWLEQVGSRQEVPFVAGITAAAEQGVRPYLESGQLRGLLSGLVGAAEYELATQGRDRARATMGAQSAAHLVILFFVVVGNLTYLVTKVRKGKRWGI